MAATHLLCPGSVFPVHILYELMSLRRRLRHLFQSASAVRYKRKTKIYATVDPRGTTQLPGNDAANIEVSSVLWIKEIDHIS